MDTNSCSFLLIQFCIDCTRFAARTTGRETRRLMRPVLTSFLRKNKKLLFVFVQLFLCRAAKVRRRSLRPRKKQKAVFAFCFKPAHNPIDTKRTLAFCIARAAIQKARFFIAPPTCRSHLPTQYELCRVVRANQRRVRRRGRRPPLLLLWLSRAFRARLRFAPMMTVPNPIRDTQSNAIHPFSLEQQKNNNPNRKEILQHGSTY